MKSTVQRNPSVVCTVFEQHDNEYCFGTGCVSPEVRGVSTLTIRLLIFVVVKCLQNCPLPKTILRQVPWQCNCTLTTT